MVGSYGHGNESSCSKSQGIQLLKKESVPWSWLRRQSFCIDKRQPVVAWIISVLE